MMNEKTLKVVKEGVTVPCCLLELVVSQAVGGENRRTGESQADFSGRRKGRFSGKAWLVVQIYDRAALSGCLAVRWFLVLLSAYFTSYC